MGETLHMLPRSHCLTQVLILRLRGGLGNQLFEYAAARALALQNRVPLWLDTTYGFRDDRYGRFYELGAFNVIQQNLEASPLSWASGPTCAASSSDEGSC